jgi:hypothetical protein
MNFKSILPEILNDLKKTKYFKKKNRELMNTVLQSIIVLYVEKNDMESQKFLSQAADIRIAWGGIEGISAFLKLPKKLNVFDGGVLEFVEFLNEKKEKLKNKNGNDLY